MKHVVRLLVFAAFPFGPVLVSAQDWPTRPVRIVSPFAAGGTADILARMVADHLTKRASPGGARQSPQIAINSANSGLTALQKPATIHKYDVGRFGG
jgi:tripartite-type tricarboxylate transporter receptor subunit TctC